MRGVMLAVLAVMLAVQGWALELSAKAAYVVHPETGTVLLNQNGDERMGPASLTKLMTLYLLFDSLKQGEYKLTDEFPVSEKAWRMGGSKMFVEVGKTVPVESLIRGIAIVSGNDACVVVAEKLGGTEDGFAGFMNTTAQRLGMTNTHFVNASGWPDPAQYSTAHDIAMLVAALLRDFPEYKHYLTEEEFVWNGIKQQNRNGLLHAGVGIDIGKTGHTEESGFHLASSAVQKDQRLITVVMGTSGFAAREGESMKAYQWFFAQNKPVEVATPGQMMVGDVPVWHGTQGSVGLTVAEPLHMFINPAERGDIKVKATYNRPIVAPVAADKPLGELTVTLPSGQTFTTALVAGREIPQAGFFTRWLQSFIGLF
ncbi:MAG: D-alanyl-D-alanine carboxypeptidase [Pseudomonadaceae bacterium]|nr:D-alanyl-D-alanine carboxypeptidase [Pseudomonadaceae bacterium]